MPIKIIRQNYWEIIGRGAVLLSNPPAADQTGELYTGRIVEDAALLSRAHAIIGKEAKATSDPSAPQLAATEFVAGTRRFLEDHGVQCVLVISGRNESGIEIQTSKITPDQDKLEIIRARLALDFDLSVSAIGGENSESNLAVEAKAIRLALGPDERGFRKEAVVAGIADVVGLINAKLGFQADERISDILD
jgi:hypothetical protein